MFILQGCQFVFYLTFRVDSELISQDSYEIFFMWFDYPMKKSPREELRHEQGPLI